ncbi:hypothetical protein [Algoriphagus halophilus]|uniref:Viral A-type inclusion protein n=1 Tax=Algoriphagus halophilus TaxID=226505 RepID=A0A1N6D463_9BACT|nr:hypothetical protein [Algoriphagus halophilus]SIN65620.1 hypothetical protein SAMN05444394_0178 [Algoriphagus halophilus]
MIRYISILTFVLLIVLTSCGPSIQEQNLMMREKIIEIHDEVMPMMGRLKSLEKKANQEIDRLEEENPDTARIEELKVLAVDLNAAYDGMFDWMHQYEATDGDRTPEEVKVFLDEQLIKISEVNAQFKEVLTKADEMLPS